MATAVKPDEIKSAAAEVKPTVGSVLNTALSSIEKTLLETARKTHHYENIFQACSKQAYTALVSLQRALTRELKATAVENADKPTQELLGKVDALVNTGGHSSELQTVAAKVKELIELPPLNDQSLPLLSEMGPFIITNKEESSVKAEVVFRGRFPYGHRNDCAWLTVDRELYYPFSGSATELRFVVKLSNEYLQKLTEKGLLNDVRLEVKHATGIFPWNWGSKEFTTVHGILENSPGRVTVLFTSPGVKLTKPFTSETIEIKPSPSAWLHTETHTLTPEQGWRFNLEKAKVNWIKPPEEHAYYQYREKTEEVVKLDASSRKGSGTCVFECEQVQTDPTRTKTITFEWNTSLVITPKEGEEITKVDYELMNGTRGTVIDGSLNHPLVKMTGDKKSIKVDFIKAEEVMNKGTSDALTESWYK